MTGLWLWAEEEKSSPILVKESKEKRERRMGEWKKAREGHRGQNLAEFRDDLRHRDTKINRVYLFCS